jgi:hypothetical protein
MSDEASKVPAYDAVPCCALTAVKLEQFSHQNQLWLRGFEPPS